MSAWTPAEGEFVLVVRDGRVRYPGKVVGFDHSLSGIEWALIRPVGQDADPHPVPVGELRRHPLSTQRGIPEES